MPKMSQICEGLRVPEGHKHTYLPEQLYMDRLPARALLGLQEEFTCFSTDAYEVYFD